MDSQSLEKVNILERAIAVAVLAHRGQTDRYGEIAVLHPLRVMLKVSGDVCRTVAILHDVIEKSTVTMDQMQNEGFPQNILQAVEALTKREDEEYPDYITRVAGNDLARQVKIADLEDNMNLMRSRQELSEPDIRRLLRYHQAWLILTSHKISQ